VTQNTWPPADDDPARSSYARTSFFNETGRKVAVAVSGGSDSLAALHLIAVAGAQRKWQVCGVTVDHRLRPEAAEEAQFAAAVCAGLGLQHQVLVWDHGPVEGNLQNLARRARYGLMAEWAKANGITHVVLGHTADDQAETFLMGLGREAGLDGLSGMRDHWDMDGVQFIRPFLTYSRDALRTYLLDYGAVWVDDPSNENDKFMRVKARRALKALRPLGITVEKLSEVVAHLSSVRALMDQIGQQAFDSMGQEIAGSIVLQRDEFLRLSPEVNRRLLISALRWVSGAEYAPRQQALERVQEALREGKDATLSGCRIKSSETDIRITREPKTVAGLVCATDQLWDGRWRFQGPHEPGLTIRPLGTEGLRQCKDWRATGAFKDALIVTPAIWRDETLIAAPLAGFSEGWTATVAAGFGLFTLSH
jgi:tRNA(Ile)-lysidine synthase